MPSSTPIGVQLYTLRADCRRDLVGTLEAVAGAGYRGIELFGGFFGQEPARLKQVLQDLGLRPLAAHVSLEELENRLGEVMDAYQALGCSTLVCPWLDEERRQGQGAFEAVGRTLNRVAEELVGRGFSVAYHNHDFELRIPAPNGLERILGECAPGRLSLELDVYWLAFAGVDPAAYIRRLGSRVSLIHLKDGSLGSSPSFTPLGQGEVDLAAVIAAGEEAGVEAFIVEQDLCDEPPLESIRRSLEYLRSRGMTG